MSRAIIVRPEAEADIAEARLWYERQRKGLGEDFLLCADEALTKIGRDPELFPIVHRDVRRAVIHRFPYGIFYRVMKKRVVVIGVFHGRRDPRQWQSRR